MSGEAVAMAAILRNMAADDEQAECLPEEHDAWAAADLIASQAAEIEQLERVIEGLNRQLTEQFELSTKYVAKSQTAERLLAEARAALTPSAETKAAYMGEFTIAVERHVNDDDEVDDETDGAGDPYEHIMVPWTTIKEIMAAISARTLTNGGENGR